MCVAGNVHYHHDGIEQGVTELIESTNDRTITYQAIYYVSTYRLARIVCAYARLRMLCADDVGCPTQNLLHAIVCGSVCLRVCVSV